MKNNENLEKKLHDTIIERQFLINEKNELSKQISLTKAELLVTENKNSFYKKELIRLENKLNVTIKSLERIERKLKLLFSKLRIVRINLQKDHYLNGIAPDNNNLSKAIDEISCYGCVETGEIFEGPNYKDIDEDIPVSSLDKFENTSKIYRKNINH